MNKLIEKLQFNEKGLIPAIAQDVDSKKVLMMAWMNKESIEETLKTGLATYFSRSRNEIWQKGKTSGHFQQIVKIETDCDFDTILLSVKQTGVACHTGSYSCFFNEITR